jgi:hypothetical protein
MIFNAMIFFALAQIPQPVPIVQVIDLDGGEPRHVIVILNGEPIKAITVPLGGGGPSPKPAPPIPPDPIPAVVTGTLWVTYILPEVPNEKDTAPVVHSPLRIALATTQSEWRVQGANDAEIARRKFDAYTKDAPVAIFQDQNGKVVKTLKGNDPQSLVDAVKQLKGTK